MTTQTISRELVEPQQRLSAYVCLTKPRILVMVCIMTAAGYFLGGKGLHSPLTLILTLIGTALSSGGAAVLNNYIERDCDSLMHRTRTRPLPQGRIAPHEALAFGITLVLLGVCLLAAQVNLLTGFLSLLTVFLYVLVYTPLKRVSWLNTLIGAIPGALPPMGGWAAATGHIDFGAWVLFAILFVWQHPHFYAIAWMYREDYARGGFKMLPVVEPDGESTFRQVLIYSLILIPLSMVPTFIGMAGMIYCVGITLAGFAMLYVGWQVSQSRTNQDARKLLKTSVIYLPIFFGLILTDLGF